MPVCERPGLSLVRERNGAFVVMIQSVQEGADAENLDLRFVGGVISDLIGPETTLGRIDFANRELWLENTRPIELMRNGGDSVKDIDAFSLTTGMGVKSLKAAVRGLNRRNRSLRVPPIPVSIESVHQVGTKPWYKPQLVSFIEVDDQGRYYLTFDSIREKLTRKHWRAGDIIYKTMEKR